MYRNNNYAHKIIRYCIPSKSYKETLSIFPQSLGKQYRYLSRAEELVFTGPQMKQIMYCVLFHFIKESN